MGRSLSNFGISEYMKKRIEQNGGIDIDKEFLSAVAEVAQKVSYSEEEKSRLEEIKRVKEIVKTGNTVILDDIQMIEALAELEFLDFIDYIKSVDYKIGEGSAGKVFLFKRDFNGIVLPSSFCYKVTRYEYNPEKNSAHEEGRFLNELFLLKNSVINEVRSLLSSKKSKIMAENKEDKWTELSKLINTYCVQNVDSAKFCPLPLEFAEGVYEEHNYLFMETIKGLSIEDFIKTISKLLSLERAGNFQEVEYLMEKSGISEKLLEAFFNNENSMIFFREILEKMIEIMHNENTFHRDLHERNIMINFDNLLPTFVDFGESGNDFANSEESQPYTYQIKRTTFVLDGVTYKHDRDHILSEEKIKHLKANKAKEHVEYGLRTAPNDESFYRQALTNLQECVINDGAQFLRLISRRKGGDLS